MNLKIESTSSLSLILCYRKRGQFNGNKINLMERLPTYEMCLILSNLSSYVECNIQDKFFILHIEMPKVLINNSIIQSIKCINLTFPKTF